MSGVPGLSPVEAEIAGSGSGGVSTNIVQIGGTAVNPAIAATGALPIEQLVGGAAVSTANSLPTNGTAAKQSSSSDWRYPALAGGITDTSDVVLKAAAGPGFINTLGSLQIVNAAAGVNTEVVIKDGSTVIWRGYAPASIALVTQLQMVPITFDPPLYGSTNTALNFACITTASKTYVNAQGWVVG